MRKVDLKPYDITQKVQANSKDGIQEVDAVRAYDVKESILRVLFMPKLMLMGPEIIKQEALALKIEAANDGEVTLTETEYERLKNAVEKYPAQSRADVQFVNRILNETPEI